MRVVGEIAQRRALALPRPQAEPSAPFGGDRRSPSFSDEVASSGSTGRMIKVGIDKLQNLVKCWFGALQ